LTIAGRINLLVAGVALFAGVLLTLVVAQRDFIYQRDALVLEASGFVASKPHLPLVIYYRDQPALERLANELLELSPATRHATLYSSQGEVLARSSREWAGSDRSPPFSALRSGLLPMDTGLRTRRGGYLPGALESLAFLERTTSLTLPISSVVNPLDEGLTPDDFARSILMPDTARSLHVIGYVELAISSTLLWRESLPTVALSAAVGLAIVFVVALIARLLLRSVTAPLRVLTRVADEIAAGKRTRPLQLRGSGELHEIARVLNSIITGLNQHRTQLDTDRKMLSMKVTERSEALSKQQEALDAEQRKINESRDKMRQMAYFDMLTTLPNRRLFTEQLTLLLRLAARHKHRVGLLLIDIDHFKRINDSLGAKAGDTLLKEISARLTAGVRDSDVLHRSRGDDGSLIDMSRLGGDEFTVVLNQIENLEAALTVAQRLSESIHRPMHIDGQEIIVTASIGVALAPEHASDVESLLRAAGTAMITAKKRGRNSVLAFDDSMEGTNRERLQLETDLRKAIERGELLLHYQPQVHSGSGQIVGAEALVRWKHPTHGLVPPFVWIPMAEDIGIISDVGDWVLGEACRTLRAIRAEGLVLPKVSVNVSALQFTEDFIGRVELALREHQLPAESLELELTEGIMINDDPGIVDIVKRLKALGLRLSIDDFGTGYSSLGYLSRFPLDELKIDRSFVVGLRQGKREAELLRAIIALGHGLGLEIVVEGVETPEELQFFRGENAEVIQGYLFSPPVTDKALCKLLAPGHFDALLRTLTAVPAPATNPRSGAAASP
jgi:diguanylate cyclase (GGDEF)-like protein